MSENHDRVLRDAHAIKARTPERNIAVPAVFVDPDIEKFLKDCAERDGGGGVTAYVYVGGRAMRLTLERLP